MNGFRSSGFGVGSGGETIGRSNGSILSTKVVAHANHPSASVRGSPVKRWIRDLVASR